MIKTRIPKKRNQRGGEESDEELIDDGAANKRINAGDMMDPDEIQQ